MWQKVLGTLTLKLEEAQNILWTTTVHHFIATMYDALKEGEIEIQVVDNQYKLVLTLFTIGYSGVSGAQWHSSLGWRLISINLVTRCE